MSTPAYDGKGQPPMAQGWFSGLAAWWNGLTPQYVTHSSGGISTTSPSKVSKTARPIGPAGAPASAPARPADSSDSAPAASGTRPSSAPSAAKP